MTHVPRQRDTPLVTVGIPFHDEEAFLERAIASVLAQSYEDLEILLVDDGSTDRSLEIARSFDDPRVTVVSDGERRFLAARLNEITRRARGSLIARMDADDVAHRDRIRHQVDVLVEDARCDAVATWVGLIGVEEEPFAVVEAASLPSSLEVAVLRGLFAHATLVGRRAFFEQNPYDETLTRAEDRDLWCRTVHTTTFRVVPLPLYVVRVHVEQERFLPKYLEAQEQNRALLLRYGASAMGLHRTALEWTRFHAKGALMRLAVQLGFADGVVRRRGRPPTDLERAMIAEALALRSCN